MDDLLRRVEAALAGRYEIESELGRGGMAVVYQGRDLRHERDVAIKVLPPQLASAIGHERFLHEIKLAAGLAHPYVVPILDSGEADGLLYYTMPVVRGETLQARLRREAPLPIDEAVTITSEVAEALALAHARGVLHRDVKPSNILLTADHALLSDFGVARAAEASGDDRLTGTGVIIGTPAYMSPQQALSEDGFDASADQYSLACVLYEMLAGRVPFQGDSPQAILLSHVTREPVPLRDLRPELPAALAAAVERAMAKDPKDRFPSIVAFRKALTAGLGGMTNARRHRDAPGAEWSPGRRAVAVILLGLAAAGVAWGIASQLVGRASDVAAASDAAASGQIAVLPCRVEPALGSATDSLGVVATLEILAWLERGPDFHLMPWSRVAGREYPPPHSLRAVAEELGAESLVACTLGPGRADSVVLTYDIWLGGPRVTRRHSLERMSDDHVNIRPVAGEVATILSGIPTSGEPAFALTEDDLAWERYRLAIRAFGEGQFAEAETLFVAAYREDDTFFIARYRAADARRWQLKPGSEDTPLDSLYEQHPDRFGRRYGLYLSALTLPPGPAAFDRFETILDSLPDDDHAHLLYGDELLHRGPLFGRGLDVAEGELRRATELNPRSSPAWDHLAVAFQLEGRDSAASRALRGLRDALPGGENSEKYLLWRHAWRERFRPAEAVSQREMLTEADPEALAIYARYGVRLFDLPDLQLALGLVLAQRSPTGTQAWHSGTNATALAHASLGRPEQAAKVWRHAAAAVSPENRAPAELFAHLWDVLPGALGLEGFGAETPESVRALDAIATDTAAPPLNRARAAWALARLAAAGGGPEEDAAFERRRGAVESLTQTDELDLHLDGHLRAVAAARASRLREAVEQSRALIVYDSTGNTQRPFGRAAVRLDRGSWFAELALLDSDSALADSAVASWIWHLNTDLEGNPAREVQAGEVDAAFGTHARLRIARLAAEFAGPGNQRDRERWRGIACRESGEVIRRWRKAAEESLGPVISDMDDIRVRLGCPDTSRGTEGSTVSDDRVGATP